MLFIANTLNPCSSHKEAIGGLEQLALRGLALRELRGQRLEPLALREPLRHPLPQLLLESRAALQRERVGAERERAGAEQERARRERAEREVERLSREVPSHS